MKRADRRGGGRRHAGGPGATWTGQSVRRRSRRGVSPLLLVLLALVPALAACSAAGSSGAVPTWAPGATAAPQAGTIRAQLAAALSARNLILDDAKVPFRPAEPPEISAAPRTVYQVQLRDDPAGGFIVVYDLGNAPAATAAGSALATYLSSGPGRVQSPLGTVHVIRQIGTNLVYYRWLPGAATDPLTPGIQQALETIGISVPVPQ